MFVRFRVDGILYNVLTIPAEIYPNVVSRVKVLSDMDISERKITQEGRVTVKGSKGNTIELLAENPDYKTIVIPADATDFELEGIAVGLIRNTMLM